MALSHLQSLEELAKCDSAPDDMVDSVVNGAVLDFISDCVPTLNDFVQIYGPDCKSIYVKKIEMTSDKWTDSLTNTIHGISRERSSRVLEHMYEKGILVINLSNHTY